MKSRSLQKILAAGSLAVMLSVAGVGLASANTSTAGTNGHDPNHNHNSQHDSRQNQSSQSGKNGYDKNGYDKNGYDRNGYNRQGYDRNGRQRNNWNQSITVSGQVSSISGNALSVRSRGRTYSVDATNASVTNKWGKSISLGDVQNGDRITVRGHENGGHNSIDAQSVRDQSHQ